MVSELGASAYHVSRTPQDIARLSSDSLLIGWQVQGGGWMETGRWTGPQQVQDGILTVGHSEQPYSAVPNDNRDFLYRLIKLPLTDSPLASVRLADLAATPVDGRSRFLRPMRALFSAIAAQDPKLSDPAAGIGAIGHLALMAAGRLPHHEPESRAALRMALFHAALSVLRRDMRRPDLSPLLVARELAVSPRQLHILFEPSGLSFARTLTGFRLERVLHLLAHRPERTVADIAYDCGFDSLATFYRAFRSAYGMAPLDLRTMWQA